jgi:signal transduction histidine kinase
MPFARTSQIARIAKSGTVLVLCTAACGAIRAADVAPSGTITLDRASVTATLNGWPQAEQEIRLPLHWDVIYRLRSGTAQLALSFPRPQGSADASEPYMLFVPRIANAYTIELNGTTLATAGNLSAHGEAWSSKQPLGISFPATLLRDTNQLMIRLRGDAGRRAGVAPIILGPSRLVEPLRVRAHALRVTLPLAATTFSALVSAFCLLLWLQQREKLYAWACISEAVWALVVADVVMEPAPFDWRIWLSVLFVLRALWVWALYVIVEQVFGPRKKRERTFVQGLLWAVPFSVALAFVIDSTLPMRLLRIAMWLVWLGVSLRLFLDLRKSPTTERVLLAVGIATLGIAGFFDGVASRLVDSGFDEPMWARYVGVLLGVTIMWIVSKRFRLARAEALNLQASLAQRVEDKERELRESFERLSQLERARAVAAERERILRDMHDGVGANLATAMRQLESGAAPAEEVAATLRESLDHLKLSIDAMNLPSGDVNALLASLRYRLQRRITQAGLTVDWQVDELPHWEQGTDQAMRHLQFLLLEAISNALQHAEASTLTLSARSNDGAIEISVRDDGRGYTADPNGGLQSMRDRAQAIGAQFAIEDAAPGTRVCVRLSG